MPEAALAWGDQFVPEKLSDRMICVDSPSICFISSTYRSLPGVLILSINSLSLTSQDLPTHRRPPQGPLGQEAWLGRQRSDLTLLPHSILDGLNCSGTG